jgi:arylformamidase
MPETIYREFTTVEELNAEYDVEANPKTAAYVEAFTERSARTREELPCRLDVPFGPTREETFDVFSGGDGPRPTVFFVHGGWWRSTTSKLWSYVAQGPGAHGFTTVVENYALCPTVTVSEIVRQHRAAFAAMWHRAEELGVDRENIVVTGHSAGGHAMAALLATDWVDDYGLPERPFKMAIPVSGVFDLVPVTKCWLAPYLQLPPLEAARLSYHRPLGPAVPTLAVVGGEESAEFHRQTREWTEAGVAAGLPVRWADAPGRDHFDVLDELADPEGLITREIVAVLGREPQPQPVSASASASD